ncbi:hypothetical protein ASPWEDRAFT_183395 [Aspergillus wentii DTO 134E9]|uniref:Uncharacterized protein n=1 Tax=Aspergillus wentii DTO 134E9 TaxID=1073089 RepID=A0A1L9RK82_ASPWE|nr:uncharacterized protein ASPWEDRAFT_183395 [Aspergillus wentii DTO 134E9]OJJ35313.1 hypothetical protein ASPWEDRAFT_183395 [Aspergillus wentii DTO 134E9]
MRSQCPTSEFNAFQSFLNLHQAPRLSSLGDNCRQNTDTREHLLHVHIIATYCPDDLCKFLDHHANGQRHLKAQCQTCTQPRTLHCTTLLLYDSPAGTSPPYDRGRSVEWLRACWGA